MKRSLLFALPLWFFALSFPIFAQEEVQVRRKSMFLRGDETSLIDAKDAGLLGRLGNAVGGAISEDRSQATLKNRDKVYHFTHLEPGQRVDHTYYVLETGAWVNPYNLKEADLISQNWFAGKYLDPMGGGGTGYGETLVRDFSTRGKPYIVLTPAGKDDYYFSYEGFVNTGGIRTVINPHFVKDETVVDVTPLEHVTSCADIHTEIMNFPAMPNPGTSAYYCWYYTYGWYLKQHIKQCVYRRLKCNTETYVNANGDLHPDELKIALTVDGYKKSTLDGIAAAKDVKIGNPGDADVTRVVILDKNTVEVYFKPATLTTGEKKIVFGGKEVFKRLRFIKVIHDVPDTAVGIKKFAGFRLAGTLSKEPIAMTLTGKSIVFADRFHQCWTFSGTRYSSPTEATSCTYGGDNDAFDYVTCGFSPGPETVTPSSGHLPVTNCQSAPFVNGIKSIRWIAKDSPLDVNPFTVEIYNVVKLFLGGGLRIFPDKQTPDDATSRNIVSVEVEIFAADGRMSGKTVYIESYDVDDPSANRDSTTGKDSPVDDEESKFDNRGFPKAGEFPKSARSSTFITTNAEGKGQVEFKVSMYPGNNFKVAASLKFDDVDNLTARQNDGTLARLLYGNTTVPEMGFDASQSDTRSMQVEPQMPAAILSSVLLTVWRKLHVEIDSMMQEPRPSYHPEKKWPDIEKIVVQSVAIDTPNVGQTTLTVALISGEVDQHEGGLVWVGDWASPDIMADVIANGSDAPATVVINGVLTLAGIARITGATDVWITDDDNPQQQLPYYPRIHPLMRDIYAQIYILPEALPQPSTPEVVAFKLNDYARGVQNIRGDEKYWVSHLTTCYQFNTNEDGDPDPYADNVTRSTRNVPELKEKPTFGAATNSFAVIFKETIHDYRGDILANESENEAMFMTHETLHTGGGTDHDDTSPNILYSDSLNIRPFLTDKLRNTFRGLTTW